MEKLGMARERTLAIIKPDAFGRGLTGEIVGRINKAGFQIVAIKTMRLTKKEAEGFYAVHSARPFFGELTEFMIPQRLRRAPFDAISARASETIARTAPMPRKRPRLNWDISLPATN
jgi:hypothetical protein